MRLPDYKPLFVYFGAKSTIAHEVWMALGNVDNYVEPFFGSGAVLFLRQHEPKIETVNDADGFICNFWRAVKADSDAVAEYADWPVDECDLHARHLWLIGNRESITDRLCGNPEFYDAKVAGWWCWGACCWIGSGWCSGNGPWIEQDGRMVLGDAGRGVNRKRPHLGDAGRGVNRKRPHLGNAGQGVNRSRPHLGDADQGACAEHRTHLIEIMRQFADRLRGVRICCGDWSRICGPSPTIKHGLTGVFLDPPYSTEAGRDMSCYAVDCGKVAHDVREWAIEWGRHPLMRIVLCGYEG